VSGEESGNVLNPQIPQYEKLSRVDAIIVAVGPNDITHKKSLESFLQNYEQILKKLPAEKTVIASLPPMGPKDTKGRSSQYWGDALKPIAAKYNVAVAPVFDKVNPRANDFRIYGGDFYHPGEAGYKLWADAFEQPLLKILDQ
jgi:lysophospholipase L1-like esterase